MWPLNTPLTRDSALPKMVHAWKLTGMRLGDRDVAAQYPCTVTFLPCSFFQPLAFILVSRLPLSLPGATRVQDCNSEWLKPDWGCLFRRLHIFMSLKRDRASDSPDSAVGKVVRVVWVAAKFLAGVISRLRATSLGTRRGDKEMSLKVITNKCAVSHGTAPLSCRSTNLRVYARPHNALDHHAYRPNACADAAQSRSSPFQAWFVAAERMNLRDRKSIGKR